MLEKKIQLCDFQCPTIRKKTDEKISSLLKEI